MQPKFRPNIPYNCILFNFIVSLILGHYCNLLFPEFEFCVQLLSKPSLFVVGVVVERNEVAEMKSRNVDLFSSSYLPRLLESRLDSQVRITSARAKHLLHLAHGGLCLHRGRHRRRRS